MNCCCPCGADKKTTICAYLREHHTGKSRAIHSEDLQRLFCLDGRNIRRKISALRQAITLLTIRKGSTTSCTASTEW